MPRDGEERSAASEQFYQGQIGDNVRRQRGSKRASAQVECRVRQSVTYNWRLRATERASGAKRRRGKEKGRGRVADGR